VLKRMWDDPYIVRNGRSGQRQHGVDCYGLPKHLGGASTKRYAGAQCKETDSITIDIIEEEVEKSKDFKPGLTEYLVMTKAPRDASVQQEVRNKTWPFDRVHVLFWDDISLELSGYEDLLQKHFPGWMKRRTTEEHVLGVVLSSEPEDFRYDDNTGVIFHKSDVSLRIVFERGKESNEEFHEPWVLKFPNPRGTRQPVYIYYGQTRIMQVPCVYVDGGRHVIPYPRSANDLTLTPFRYHIGRILNNHIRGHDFDFALERAGITVRE
jgi:hypothetical protein